ncbi:MAG: ATP-binding protein [Gammaproteobacteria bacterium]|nr:ATP-binding protein [Gammaproteobacteria bacterium]MDH5653729.1 ATP-binding protein [Gammaproteobacteria bacterium]
MKEKLQKLTFLWLVLGTLTVSLTTATISIRLLYKTAYNETLKELQHTATSLASIMQAVAEFDQRHSEMDHPQGSWGATISQIEQGLRNYHKAHATEELVIGRRDGDNLVITHRNIERGIEHVTIVKGDGSTAQPLMHALLKGETGRGEMLDYKNKIVLAGYAPVPALDIGVVYKFDLAEMQAPYIRAALWAVGCAILLTLFGAVGFAGFIRPLQQQAESAQQQLLAQRDALNEAQRMARIGSWELEHKTSTLYWSDEVYRILEVSGDIRPSSSVFMDAVHPDDRDLAFDTYTLSLTAREPCVVLLRLQMADGRIKYVRESCETIYRDDGKPFHSRGTVQDISELYMTQQELEHYRQNLEALVQERTRELQVANEHLQSSLEQLRMTQNQLVQSEKMASLGGMVAGITHEINTPIGMSMTAISHLQMKLEEYAQLYQDGELTRADFEKMLQDSTEGSRIIMRNLDSAAELIRSFKKVAVDQTSNDLRLFNLKQYLDEIVYSLRPRLRKSGHTVSIECSREINIYNKPGALAQVLTNLIMNSLDHGFEERDCGEVRLVVKQKGGDRIQLDYSDNGTGISRENIDRIFEPFFTTKRGKGGSGLGMYIVYNIVTQTMGGTIECSSIEGEGTLFRIIIPGVSGQLSPESRLADAG